MIHKCRKISAMLSALFMSRQLFSIQTQIMSFVGHCTVAFVALDLDLDSQHSQK